MSDDLGDEELFSQTDRVDPNDLAASLRLSTVVDIGRWIVEFIDSVTPVTTPGSSGRIVAV